MYVFDPAFLSLHSFLTSLFCSVFCYFQVYAARISQLQMQLTYTRKASSDNEEAMVGFPALLVCACAFRFFILFVRLVVLLEDEFANGIRSQ